MTNSNAGFHVYYESFQKKFVRFSWKSCEFSKNVRIFVSDFLVNKPTTWFVMRWILRL